MEDGTTLFKQHYAEVLSLVEMIGPCKKEDIYERLEGSKKTKVNHVNELIDLGLLSETMTGQYNKKIISITIKGREVLKEMRRIMAIMNGEVVPDERNHGTPSAHDAKAGGE